MMVFAVAKLFCKSFIERPSWYFVMWQILRMATQESFGDVYEAFRIRDNLAEVFTRMLHNIGNEVHLGAVKLCLTIGPGEGLYEVGFLQKCADNVTSVVAVEQDRKSAERLRARLRESLPNVDGTVIEADFRSWKGPDDRVDVVLLFHVLYYYGPSERREFLRKVHDRWLAAGGFVVLLSASRTKSPGNSNEIFERLGSPLVSWEDIEAELLEIGFVKKHAYEVQFERDFSNPDESYLRFFQSHVDQPVTLDDVRSAIEEIYPHGKTNQCFNMLAVFQRKY